MVTTVLFDLDGTLLPMELYPFMDRYFTLLIEKLSAHGYDPQKVNDGMWDGLHAMLGNDGSRTNEEAFWDAFCAVNGRDCRGDADLFHSFYLNEFQGARTACGFDPEAAKTVAAVKEKGFRVVLATNPLYPPEATISRIRWAGMEPEDFELFTTFETYHHCKPNPDYYRELLEKLDLRPEECIMVGNDASEDLAALDAGIPVFLLPRYLVNRHDRDISDVPQGDFQDLLRYLDTLN